MIQVLLNVIAVCFFAGCAYVIGWPPPSWVDRHERQIAARRGPEAGARWRARRLRYRWLWVLYIPFVVGTLIGLLQRLSVI